LFKKLLIVGRFDFETEMRSQLIQSIQRHPHSSVQDGLLIAAVMLVATLLALQYDLFSFIAELSDSQRKISLAEALFLTALLALCLFTFVVRRLGEDKRDVAHDVAANSEIRKLRKLALQDPLTGLANRRALVSALSRSTFGEGNQHALLLIDLDRFKQINDQYGHAVGDRVLHVVANRLAKAIRPGDLVGRLGGDEFAVLSYAVDRDAASTIGSRIVEAMRKEVSIGGHAFRVGVSVGVALIPQAGITAEEILENADIAMYAAKRQSDLPLVFFEPNLNRPQKIAALP
jgi:diguanylate cyclase (GGDEF)-like protein